MAPIDLGIIAALIAAIIFGSYITPLKITKLTSNQYASVMLVFATIVSIGILFYSKESFNFRFQDLPFPIISGIIFSIGLALTFFSIQTIGINRAAAIYIGLQLVVAALIGIVFFNELGPLSSIQRIETAVGIVLVLSGIVLISVAKL